MSYIHRGLDGLFACGAANARHNGRLVRVSRLRGAGDHLGLQRGADVTNAAVLPLGVSGGAEREQHQVIVTGAEFVHFRWGHGGDDIHFQGNLPAIRVQGQVIYVVAEGILDLATNSGKSENDVCGNSMVLELLYSHR